MRKGLDSNIDVVVIVVVEVVCIENLLVRYSGCSRRILKSVHPKELHQAAKVQGKTFFQCTVYIVVLLKCPMSVFWFSTSCLFSLFGPFGSWLVFSLFRCFHTIQNHVRMDVCRYVVVAIAGAENIRLLNAYTYVYNVR